MIITSDEGALEILEAYFKGRDLELRLFTNDHIPADTDTVATYTEAVGGGYDGILLDKNDWTGGIVSNIAQVAQAVKTFTFTGALTTNRDVYGHYVVNTATGKLVYAERANDKVTPANPGDIVNITPVCKLSKGTPT